MYMAAIDTLSKLMCINFLSIDELMIQVILSAVSLLSKSVFSHMSTKIDSIYEIYGNPNPPVPKTSESAEI